MATGVPDDDDGVDPEDRDELPLDDVLLLLLEAELPLDVLPLDVLLLDVLLVALWCVVAGRAAAIPATPSTLARPTPAVTEATFFLPRRRAA